MRWSAADLADEIDYLDEPELLEILRDWRAVKQRFWSRILFWRHP